MLVVVTSDIEFYASWPAEALEREIEKQEKMAARFQRAYDKAQPKHKIGFKICVQNCQGKIDNYKLALMVKAERGAE